MDQHYQYPCLPLAVYRELAAHLRQVDGLAVELLPQMATTFDYRLSQLGGLQLQWDDQTHPWRTIGNAIRSGWPPDQRGATEMGS
jgi:hypothetical protein